MKRTSPIWGVTDAVFCEMAAKATSLGEMLSFFGLENIGHNPRTLKERLIALGIDPEEIIQRYQATTRVTISLEDILVQHSKFPRGSLRRRLHREKILPQTCQLCGSPSEWQGSALTLVLDHINGVPDDHRIENLRMLCPNCNSQQSTFCGKNKPRKHKRVKPTYNCTVCETPLRKASKTGRCSACAQLLRAKIPAEMEISLEQVSALVQQFGYSETGRRLGVSYATVKKWIKKGNIPKRR
jgi:transposase-like protein